MIEIWTDGACSGNGAKYRSKSIGGWAAVLKCGNYFKSISGGEQYTTNNRMEIKALIEALRILNNKAKDEHIMVYTDSKYVHMGFGNMQVNHMAKWANVANDDLWKELYEVSRGFDIETIKIPGHAGIQYNEVADKLATGEVKKLKERLGVK